MTAGGERSIFRRQAAASYDAWYLTDEGRRADRLEKELIIKLLNPQLNESLLEVGCGTGHNMPWFKEIGLRVVGVDNSHEMIKQARLRLGGAALLFRAPAEKLPFSDSSFDYAALITTLEFTNDPASALKEAMRVSRKAVFLGVLNKYSLLAFKRRLKSLLVKSVYRKARFFSLWEIKELIRKIDGQATVEWASAIPGGPSHNPFNAFLGILIKKIE